MENFLPQYNKPFGQLDDEHKKMKLLYKIVMIELANALKNLEYVDIKYLTSNKKMWETLLKVHKGDTHVLEAKVEGLVGKLDGMKMNENETIAQYGTRVKEIVATIKRVGGSIDENEVVRKNDKNPTSKICNQSLVYKRTKNY